MQEQVERNPLIGYRQWEVRSDRLCSVYQSAQEWTTGENEAYCWHRWRGDQSADESLKHPTDEPIPGEKCSCGLHAFYTMENATLFMRSTSSDVLCGSVVCGGRSAFDKRWFRSQKQVIVALLHPGDHPGLTLIDRLWGDWTKIRFYKDIEPLIYEHSISLGVPILRRGEIEEYSLQYGDEATLPEGGEKYVREAAQDSADA